MKYIASLTLKLGARPVESPPAPSKPARRGGPVQSHMGRPGDTLVTPLKVAKKKKKRRKARGLEFILFQCGKLRPEQNLSPSFSSIPKHQISLQPREIVRREL